MSSIPTPPDPPPSPSTLSFALPGPPSRNNLSAADISSAGLLAYAAGSSVSVVDTRSLQLVSVVPLPSPSPSSLSPFVTSVRWAPLSLSLHSSDLLSSNSHLLLAAGDRQGRICLLDLRSQSPFLWFETEVSSSGSNSVKLGIQDLCWIRSGSEAWILATISGSSVLSLYETVKGRCFFRYDAGGSDMLSCVRRDPFDCRSFVMVGLRSRDGFLMVLRGRVVSENTVAAMSEVSDMVGRWRDKGGKDGGGF